MPQIPHDHADTREPEALQSLAPEEALHTAWHNEASTKDAQANFLDGLNDLLYHPETGFLTQRGAAALNSHQAAQQGVGKLFQSATDALGNDEQRKLFDQATRPLLDNAMAQLQRHAQGQSRVYDTQASQARRQSATQLAINAYTPGGDNTLYRQAAAAAHSELENAFRHQHGEPDQEDNQGMWQHYMQHGHDGTSGMAALHTGIVTRLIENGQPQHAEAYLADAGQDLSQATREKLGHYIQSAHDHRAAYSATLQAQASGDDVTQQQQRLDSLLEAGDISPTAHKIAGQKLIAAQQQLQAIQQQNEEHILQNVWKLKQGNPHAALSDLAPGDYAYLKSRGLEGNAEAILQSHPAQSDPALFNRLSRLAHENPVAFGRTSLLKESGKLSQGHLQYLKTLQQGVAKQDPRTLAHTRVLRTALNNLIRD